MERRKIPPQNRAARPNRPRNHEVETKRIIFVEKGTNTEGIDHRFYEERYTRCVIYINSLHDYINLLLERLHVFANVKLPEMPSVLQRPVRPTTPAKPATPGATTKTYRESENDRRVFVCNDGKFTNGYECTRMKEENEFVQQLKNTPLEKRWVGHSEGEEEFKYLYEYKQHAKKFLMEEDDGVLWNNSRNLEPITESEIRMNNLTIKVPKERKNKELSTKERNEMIYATLGEDIKASFYNYTPTTENARPKTPASAATTVATVKTKLKLQSVKIKPPPKEGEEMKETPDNPPKPADDVKPEEVKKVEIPPVVLTSKELLQEQIKNFQKENLPVETVSTYATPTTSSSLLLNQDDE